MARVRVVVLAGWLLLAACGGGSGTVTGIRDYIDFLRFGGVTYHVVDHGVGRPIGPGDLGPELARVRANPPTSGPPLAYRPRVVELVGQVLAAPVRPTSGRVERRYCFVVFNLADRTAVRRHFVPGTGRLWPGVVVPPAFTEAMEDAMAAKGRTCGREP